MLQIVTGPRKMVSKELNTYDGTANGWLAGHNEGQAV
jgi:hypothetical protein